MAETISYKEYASKQYVDEALANAGGATSWNDLEDKPFSEIKSETVLMEEVFGQYAEGRTSFGMLVVGQKYDVVFDGIEYKDLVAFEVDGDVIIGTSPYQEELNSGDAPFFLVTFDGGWYEFGSSTDEEHSFRLSQMISDIHTLDEKYLPETVINVNADWYETDENSSAYIKNKPMEMGSHVVFEAIGTPTLRYGVYRIPVFKVDENLTGNNEITFKFVFDDEEREFELNTSVKTQVHVIGNEALLKMGGADTGEDFELTYRRGEFEVATRDDQQHYVKLSTPDILGVVKKLDPMWLDGKLITIGQGINAEAFNGVPYQNASGEGSHAEGFETIAAGNYSHAEGSGAEANSWYAHAEGYKSVANDYAAHAEGNETLADGSSSHAEGAGSITRGYAAHAEGWNTIATGEAQHAQGKCNIEDTNNTYVHIVGNGENDSSRSNAHTLDWDGNAWYAGTIKFGGTSYDDASEVALKSEVPTKTESWTFTLEDGSTVTKAVYVG